MKWADIPILAMFAGLWPVLTLPAYAQEARIGSLADVSFGTTQGLFDQSKSQNVAVCSYRNRPQRLSYSVIASGSGSGGAFQLNGGAGVLPFDVLWTDSPGLNSGTMLQAGMPAVGFANAANGFDCPAQSGTASLTITIRSADLAIARAGNYSGLLRITIKPE